MMRTPSRVLAIDWSGDKQNARRKILGMSACGLVVFMPSLASGLFGASEDGASAQVRDNPQSLTPKTQSQRPLDPMNRPMEELGVTGHDTTLCSDRWNTCSSYDRQQFDQKYPGQRLNELLLYGEPSWPSGEHERRGGTDFHDSPDRHDRLEKE